MWGFNFVALKLLYQQMTPQAVSLVRFVPMYLLLVLVCRYRGESLKYGPGSWPVLWQGFVSLGLYMVLFLEGMKSTTAAEGAIVLAVAPVFSAIFSVIAKQERFTPGTILGAILAVAGTAIVMLVGAQTGHGLLKGNLLILASAITWAYGAVLSKSLVTRYSPVQALTMGMPAALVILIPYGIMGTLSVKWGELTTQTWLMLLHVVVGAGAIGFLGFYEGVKKIGPAAAMLYQYFVPLLATFFAYLMLKQSLNPWQAVGLAIVILGVAIASKARYEAALRASLATS